MKTENIQSNPAEPTLRRSASGAAARSAGAVQERRALWFVGGVGVGIAALATPFLGASAVPHLLFGVFISVANLWVITRTVHALLSGQFQLSIGAMAFVKLCVLMVVLYALFQAGWIQGLPLFIGLGCLPIGIVMMQLAPVKTPNEESSSART